ncbi:MAG: hypothetical protein JXB30_13535, partial [Anaerolineae bacterium]|nr:hypothetical protein [Anaerolineae bacterium]
GLGNSTTSSRLRWLRMGIHPSIFIRNPYFADFNPCSLPQLPFLKMSLLKCLLVHTKKEIPMGSRYDRMEQQASI